MARPSRRRRSAGFTLIELMVAVAIVAILATIAYASYAHFVVKARRSAAAVCLQAAAQYMERYYTTNNMSYADASSPASCDDISDFYALSFSDTPSATEFTLQATPLGTQLSADTSCGTLTIDQSGARGYSGTASDASECW
ncbi:MAG: type IV pilin protein [Pseudomonas sp.]